MRSKNYSCNTSFLDLLFNMLLAFTALFVLAFAMMNLNKKTTPEIRGSYLITVTWPEEFDDDVDTYVQDPESHLIFFQRREDGLMHLDRDDLGKRNDAVNTEFGVVTFKENREIVTLRGTLRGEYCVNVHMYRRGNPEAQPVEVTIQLDKVTPRYEPVAQKKVTLDKNGDEATAFRFTVNSEGKIIGISSEPKSLTRASVRSQPIPGDPTSQ